MWLVTKLKNELFNYFKPESYELDKSADPWQLIVIGRKTGPPSRRITLHQKGLRILSAKLKRQDKKPMEFTVERINHMPTFDQVRIHTKEVQYPGIYRLELSFRKGKSAAKPSRELMPSVDESSAWEKAMLEIKQ